MLHADDLQLVPARPRLSPAGLEAKAPSLFLNLAVILSLMWIQGLQLLSQLYEKSS